MTTIASLKARYEEVTTRWSWAPENMRHDLELNLGHAIARHGPEVVAQEHEEWIAEVAAGEAKGHLYGFLKRLERLQPTPQVEAQKPSVGLRQCGGCGQDFTVLTTASLCMRCDFHDRRQA